MYSRTADISYFTGNAMQTAYNDRNPFIVPNSVVQVGVDDKEKPIYAENTVGLTPTQIYNFWNNGGWDRDAGFLIDKSYVKLRSVVLSWDLPSKEVVRKDIPLGRKGVVLRQQPVPLDAFGQHVRRS